MKNIIGAKSASTDLPPAPQQASVRHVVVDEESAGQRLDNYLFRHLKGVPKTHVYRIIRSGEVRINKGRAAAETRVAGGDTVRLPPIRVSEKPAAPPAPSRNFPVLLEDDWLLAIDKPAGVAVHGGSGVDHGVIEQLRSARPRASLLELVHRLDRDTSGVLLIAKKRSALTRLQLQFRERDTAKTYLALVDGVWPANRKVLDQPLARYLLPDGERRVRVVPADHPDAMKAVTLVRVVATLPSPGGGQPPMTWLAVTIKTGRTHQIRVHLASAGHPIAGDDKYGQDSRNRALRQAGLARMALHAWRLGFSHPDDGAPVHLEALPPPALAAWLPESAVAALADWPSHRTPGEGRETQSNTP